MIIGLIPSRLNSTRLHQKPLMEIDGLPLIVHTVKRSQLAECVDRVIVCTDSKEIVKVVKKHGGEAILTRKVHKNGTERIAEVAKKFRASLIVDIQGDEPLINPKDIDSVVKFHKKNKQFEIVVPSLPSLRSGSKHSVKMVFNKRGKVMYLSRAELPFSFKKNPSFYSKHLSIISFKPKALKKFSTLPQGRLESIEGIELLRALENDISVGTFTILGNSFSVDVKEDLTRAKTIMPIDPIRQLY